MSGGYPALYDLPVAASNGPTATAAGDLTLGGDMTVRRLGYGAMRITGPGIWGEPEDRDGAIAVLRRAVELDVNLIDTADSYGPYVSEELIAEALYPYPDDLVIATKGGLTRPGPNSWVPDCRPERLKKCCEDSLMRLKLDTIDLYQLHTPDPKVPFEESVGALSDLRDEGKVRHVGLSNVGRSHVDTAQQIVPVVSVQNRYSLTARDSEEVLKKCEQEGLGFIPWFPLDAGGIAKEAIEDVARKHSATPMHVALARLLGHSPATLPIPGTSSVAHLEENVEAAALRLDAEDLSPLEAAA
jgi:aryl-alcohol dehydrogenase-like predicted oxidoreductase